MGSYFRKSLGEEKGENGVGSTKRPTMREGGQKVVSFFFLFSFYVKFLGLKSRRKEEGKIEQMIVEES